MRLASDPSRSGVTTPASRRPSGRAMGWMLTVVGIVAVPLIVLQMTPYWSTLCITAAITAIVLLSVGILTDRAGMLAVAPLSFAAVGAWATGWANAHEWPGGLLLWIVLGGIVTLPFGLLVGLPALRLRGINLAVITLSFSVAVMSVITIWDFPGSLDGAFILRPDALAEDHSYFLLCWGIFVFFALVVWALGRQPLGTAWRAVARSERATAAMGMSVARTKLGVFMLSAFIAGVSGALLVGQVGTGVPGSFSPMASLTIFAVAIMVGAGYPEGAVAGGIFGAFMPEVMRLLGLPQDLGNILFAVGAIQVLGAGVSMSGAWRASGRRFVRKRRRKDVAAAAAATETVDLRADRRPATGAAPALRTRELTVRYGNVVALDALSVSIPRGAVHGLIGPNGAGKSTFVDAVTGFIPRYEGTIELDGSALEGRPVHRRVQGGIRRTFQQERTIPELSVGQYVRLAARRSTTAAEVRAVLAFVGAPPADEPISEIDVGARRLVEIAGCLAARPHILLLDEPTAGLAQAESLAVAECIAQMPERIGCSVLLIEHDMDVVTASCSHITVLDFGKEIANGTPDEVLQMGSVVSAYLGEQGVAV